MDEFQQAEEFVIGLITDFVNDNLKMPTELHISDDEELQSLIMWAGLANDLKVFRTSKRKTYVR